MIRGLGEGCEVEVRWSAVSTNPSLTSVQHRFSLDGEREREREASDVGMREEREDWLFKLHLRLLLLNYEFANPSHE